MFELQNPDNKSIYVSLHMEQVYSVLCENIGIKERTGCYNCSKVTSSCVNILQKIKDLDGKNNYTLVVDFSNIRSIEPNQLENLIKWLERWKQVNICDCKLSDTNQMASFKNYSFSASNYRSEFEKYGKRYIESICQKQYGYVTQTGVKLDVYINVKKIIEDTQELFRWCYMLAYKLSHNNIYKRKYKTTKKVVLFCHTLNGSSIASTLSQLLNLDIIFVDHLGPYNKLNTINFYKDIYSPKECIIIVDMICQGNEILRAKNIIEYLGGSVKGFAGIVKLELSNLSSKKDIDTFAITFTPEEARRDLHYTIKTALCSDECNIKED